MDRILYQIFKYIIENRITFRLNGYSTEILTPETMTLLWGTENKITKDKNLKIVCILSLQK